MNNSSFLPSFQPSPFWRRRPSARNPSARNANESFPIPCFAFQLLCWRSRWRTLVRSLPWADRHSIFASPSARRRCTNQRAGTAAQRIRAFNQHSLDEFVIDQSLAIHELVEHPRRNLLRLGWSNPQHNLHSLRLGRRLTRLAPSRRSRSHGWERKIFTRYFKFTRTQFGLNGLFVHNLSAYANAA